MRERKYLFIVLLAGFLLVSLAGTYWYLERQERLAQRYQLLCAVLEPGMSKDKVLTILDKAGDFVALGTDAPGPNFELHIGFTDPIGKELYGAFDLGFKDYQYVAAHIRGFDRLDVICDFYDQIKSPTPTLNP